eukprot:gene8426-biopygen19639
MQPALVRPWPNQVPVGARARCNNVRATLTPTACGPRAAGVARACHERTRALQLRRTSVRAGALRPQGGGGG